MHRRRHGLYLAWHPARLAVSLAGERRPTTSDSRLSHLTLLPYYRSSVYNVEVVGKEGLNLEKKKLGLKGFVFSERKGLDRYFVYRINFLPRVFAWRESRITMQPVPPLLVAHQGVPHGVGIILRLCGSSITRDTITFINCIRIWWVFNIQKIPDPLLRKRNFLLPNSLTSYIYSFRRCTRGAIIHLLMVLERHSFHRCETSRGANPVKLLTPIWVGIYLGHSTSAFNISVLRTREEVAWG